MNASRIGKILVNITEYLTALFDSNAEFIQTHLRRFALAERFEKYRI